MIVLKGRNVNQLYPEVIKTFKEQAIPEDSRNGPVLVLDGPLTLHYARPQEAVLFDSVRDANPFLHFFDALFVLSDRNDSAFLKQFSNQIGEYAEEDGTLFGAYGYRMRKWFGTDQLQSCIDKLKTNPKDRRAVIGMWDPGVDSLGNSKDHPCNMTLVPRVHPDGSVSLTVYNRSNDMLWGACGANAVQFSFVLQYLAMHLDREIGDYYQVTNNPHIYTDFGPWKKVQSSPPQTDQYPLGEVKPYSFGHSPGDWDEDLISFMREPDGTQFYRTWFFQNLVKRMWDAHKEYKAKNRLTSLQNASMIEATDWKLAVTEWLSRRKF